MSSNNQLNTVFLTPEEAERMRKTFKGRFQKCQLLRGQPRVPRDAQSRSNQIATASFLSDIATAPEPRPKAQNGQPDAMVAFTVGYLYPPCIVLPQDLKPMEMSDLCLDTHHRGCLLIVRRAAPIVKLRACSWTVVQEKSSGETERLEVLLHKSNNSQDLLESGSIYQIKEPYFTLSDQGEPTLRIDHPSDLVVCTESPHFSTEDVSDSEVALTATVPKTLAAKTARQCKEEGNAALKQQALLLALANYTQGLQLLTTNGAKKEDLVYDLFRNRAHVNLLLNRFDEAKADALASLTGLEDQTYKNLDSKSYFRAGCAAYHLAEFQEAKRFFEEQQRLMPGNKDAAARIRKTKIRLQEQATGVYDFKQTKASISKTRSRVDAASFTRNVKVGVSPGRGHGLFASRNIDSGEIILCEKAFCVVWAHEEASLTAMTCDHRDDRIRVFPAGLCKAVVQKLRDNPSQIAKILDLYGDYPGLGTQLVIEDGRAVIDVFQVHDIVARNAFGPGPVSGDEDMRSGSAGLWFLAAYANHSCVPNAQKESVGDLVVLRSTRPIPTGEEITHSYDISNDYDTRTAALMNTWGFTCICALCVAEKGDSTAVRKKRRDLEGEAGAFVEREVAIGAGRVAVVRARRLARSIDDTYDEERYKGLHRAALLRIEKWLAEATTK